MAQRILVFARRGLELIALALVMWAFAWTATRWLAGRSAVREEAAVLRVLHWGDKQEDAIVASIIADFQRRPENRDIRVVRINMGQAAAVNTKLQTMMAAGDPPDVFYLDFPKVADFASKGVLEDVEKLIAEDRVRGVETLDLDDFFPNVLNCFRYDDGARRIGSGTLVGVPKDFTTVGFYYNRDLFRRAGVPEPPVTGWTWDEFIASARAIAKLPDCYGADFVTWDSMARIFVWTHGADFASPGFERFTLDDPRLAGALDRLRGWFHDESRTLFSAKTQLETGQEPFLAGNVGMAGPLGRWKVPVYRTITTFDWDFAPLPHQPGAPPVNGIFTTAWSIARDSKHKAAAWRLVKYFSSRRGQELNCAPGLAIPALRSVALSRVFSDPELKPEHDRLYLDAAEVARPIEWPADPRYLHQLRVRTEDVFKLNRPVAPTLERLEGEWQEIRRSEVLRDRYPRMPWGAVILLAIAPLGIGLGILAVRWWRARPGPMALREELAGIALVSPWLLGFAAFTAFPIVVSLLLTFTRWSGLATLDKAEFVGLDNLRQLLFHDAVFHRAIWVTALYALLAVPTGQAAALVAAVLMSQEVRGIALFRSIWYLPSVLAGVGIAVMWKWVFHHEHGMLNVLLAPLADALNVLLGSPGELTPPRWFERDAGVWGVPAFVIINLWNIGGTMMIYLAGLKGIPRELYEAAAIDGATGLRRFRHVTLPMLSPVIFFNVIIALIASFQIFTQVYVMTGGGPGDATRYYVLYLYNQAFDFHAMGYASAMAWLLLLIVLGLTMLVMHGSRRFVYYEALRV